MGGRGSPSARTWSELAISRVPLLALDEHLAAIIRHLWRARAHLPPPSH
jgi:hypothetical protein